MGTLFRKMLRDIWRLKSQFLSIFIMCALGMLIYSGIEGVWNGMEQEETAYFKDSNLADIWISGLGFDNDDIGQIKELDGINETQLSAVESAYLDSDSNVNIRLISNKDNKISKPLCINGNEYKPTEDGIWLDKDYADNKKIHVGDQIQIYYGEKSQKLEVKGLVYSPEYICYTGSSTFMVPDHSKYTYGFISADTLFQIVPNAAYNQIKITTDNITDVDSLRSDLKTILNDKYMMCYDRTEYTPVSSYINKIRQIKKMSVMFSLVFFLLALLTIYTTMTRIVRKQRTQIGILKALGFHPLQIQLHYAVYGLVISIPAALLGYELAPYTVTPVLLSLQKKFYSMPEWLGRNSYYSVILIVLLITICTLSAWISCRSIVVETPTDLLRDSGRQSQKKVFAEHFKVLWNRLSFDWRWIIRDAGQNKIRTAIGIVGVLGSMMLLMASFGLKDTINIVNNEIYGRQYTYYEKLNLSMSPTEDEVKKIESLLSGDCQWVSEQLCEAKSSMSVHSESLFIIGQGYFFTTYDTDGNVLELPDDGIILSSSSARDLNVKENGFISVLIAGKRNYLKVSRIADINSPQGIFMSQSYWESLGNTFTASALLADDNMNLDDVRQMSVIKDSVKLKKQYSESEELLDSVQGVIILLIAAAILLSVVIQYNLGLLNFTEKYREYATLRVLGSYNTDIKSLIFKSSLIPMVTGWIIGSIAGWYFLGLYVRTVSTTTISYSPHLRLISYIIVSLIVVGCSLLIQLMVCRLTAHIDMVESLKSVE